MYSDIHSLESLIPLQELINLTNDTVPVKGIDEEKIRTAIEYADEIINSYLRNKYNLPLKFIPKIISQISADIAAHRLYSRRPRKLPEHIKDRYEEAIRMLKNIQKAQMVLDMPGEHPTEDVARPAQMVAVNKRKSSRIFSDEFFERFKL